jgi:hypothetical protein
MAKSDDYDDDPPPRRPARGSEEARRRPDDEDEAEPPRRVQRPPPRRDDERRRRPDDDDEGYAEAPRQRRPEPERARPRRRRDDDDEDDDDLDVRRRDEDNPVSFFVPYKNPKGLIAYYFGVFALIPGVGNLLGPAALVLGILGIRYANAHPTAKGKGHAIAGVVLGIMTILAYWIFPIVMILIAIASSKK